MIYDRIKTLLPEQYKNATNLNKILSIFAAECDELEIVFSQIKNILNLQNATGATLDLIGDIVVEKRDGRNDDDYRKGIKFKIFKNSSTGFVEDISKILKFITEADLVVYSDNPPAAYTIYTNGLNLPTDLHKIMDKLSAAGVSLIIYASDGETPFIMTEVVTEGFNLIDDLGNKFIDNVANDIIVEQQVLSDRLQEIYKGRGMGVIEILNLTTNLGDIIIIDTGEQLGVYDADQNIIDGGKLTLVY